MTQQYKITKAFPGYPVDTIVDNTKFTDPQLTDTAYFKPYNPANIWVPQLGETFYVFNEYMAIKPVTYDAKDLYASSIAKAVIAAGLYFPTLATAQAWVASTLPLPQPTVSQVDVLRNQ